MHAVYLLDRNGLEENTSLLWTFYVDDCGIWELMKSVTDGLAMTIFSSMLIKSLAVSFPALPEINSISSSTPCVLLVFAVKLHSVNFLLSKKELTSAYGRVITFSKSNITRRGFIFSLFRFSPLSLRYWYFFLILHLHLQSHRSDFDLEALC